MAKVVLIKVPKLASRAHVLYRFWDCDGVLLYVGLTADPGRRWQAHSKDKGWWSQVARVTVEHFPDRASVEAAERTAITTEKPCHNIALPAPPPKPKTPKPRPTCTGPDIRITVNGRPAVTTAQAAAQRGISAAGMRANLYRWRLQPVAELDGLPLYDAEQLESAGRGRGYRSDVHGKTHNT